MIRAVALTLSAVALLGAGILVGWHVDREGASPPRPAASGEMTVPGYRSGPFAIAVEVEPQTPKVGSNSLRVTLRTHEGEPVSGATLRAVAEMPAMGSMPAMYAPADMEETEPGLYEGEFDLSMEGSWPLSLVVAKPGLGEARISLDMATGRSGLELTSGARHAGAGAAQADAEVPPGTVTVDANRRQLIGVRTGTAQMTDMRRSIRAVGQVVYDETQLSDVALKFDAWVGELYVDYVGASVSKGQRLLTVYGPELLAAQQELLELKRRGVRNGAADSLLAAARKRLELWDMTAAEIEALTRRGQPIEYVPIHAPRDGTVVAKHVVEGTALKAGMTLMRIADLSRVWVEAELYEAELPLVRAGMPLTIRLPYLPDRSFEGTLEFVYPFLQGQSRTGRIRAALDNPLGILKPDMYAEVRLEADLGSRLTVPEEAVIVSGDARVVFEDIGGGRLAPRTVRIGQRAGGRIEILAGLDPGDTVVTSGNFLIASESRLKAGIEQW